MLLRLRLLLFSLGTGTLLLLLLCLGSQNLAERHRLQVGSFQSASLPSEITSAPKGIRSPP